MSGIYRVMGNGVRFKIQKWVLSGFLFWKRWQWVDVKRMVPLRSGPFWEVVYFDTMKEAATEAMRLDARDTGKEWEEVCRL